MRTSISKALSVFDRLYSSRKSPPQDRANNKLSVAREALRPRRRQDVDFRSEHASANCRSLRPGGNPVVALIYSK